MRRNTSIFHYSSSRRRLLGGILFMLTVYFLYYDAIFGLLFLLIEAICMFLWIKITDRKKKPQSDIEHLQQMKKDYYK